MERYRNLSGDSGVTGYEIAGGSIAVRFLDGSVYLYTPASAGAANVLRMQQLARRGRGLSGYISRHVGGRYARRLH